jgi:hypothetical protein
MCGDVPATFVFERGITNVRKRSLHPKLVKLGLYTPGAAMHCFRRFRSAVLKK